MIWMKTGIGQQVYQYDSFTIFKTLDHKQMTIQGKSRLYLRVRSLIGDHAEVDELDG